MRDGFVLFIFFGADVNDFFEAFGVNVRDDFEEVFVVLLDLLFACFFAIYINNSFNSNSGEINIGNH